MGFARPVSIARTKELRAVLGALGLVSAVAASIAVAHASAATGSAQVKIGQTPLGRVLVDARGRTLYMFAVDMGGKSSCYGQCATFWPPLLTATKQVAGVSVKPSLLGTTVRTGGRLQVTYDRHPLYRFAEDTKAGQMKGQGLNAAGGLWWVVSPSGAVIKKSVPATPAPTTTTTPTTTSSAYP